ncbi:hypothetical protein D3C81_1697580 [compost metagenome]
MGAYIDFFPDRMPPGIDPLQPLHEHRVKHNLESLMVTVLVACFPIDIRMKIAVQQMVGEEAQEILLRFLLTGRGQGHGPLPEFDQHRAAVLRMHKIAEPERPGLFFPGKKAVI